MLPPFDPKKDAINQKKHGLSLAFGEKVIADGRGLGNANGVIA